MNVKEHVIYALRNAVIRQYPFPHFFATNVFPQEFYYDLIKQIEKNTDYTAMGGNYPDRSFGPKGAPDGLEFMIENDFMHEVMMIFYPWYKKRYGDKNCQVSTDMRLIRDKAGYQIGPHTDAAWKLVSLLFYLPGTWAYRECGTSIYLPSSKGFRCAGGPHYDFDGFNECYRAPFEPNTCFGFWKTYNSFHGVEPIKKNFNRDVLLYNVYDNDKIPKHDMISGETSPEESNHVNVRPESPSGNT